MNWTKAFFNQIFRVQKGTTENYNILPEFVDHLLTYTDPQKIKPLKLVVNAGNGAAGHVIDVIEQKFQELNISVQSHQSHRSSEN
jgi:phosphomannomutase/phosphomannomutase/phosphoglucomutase